MASYTSTLTETLTFKETFQGPWTRQASTNGEYITISVEQTTLINGLLMLINEMEAQKCSWNQTTVSVTFDTNNNVYAFTAIVRR